MSEVLNGGLTGFLADESQTQKLALAFAESLKTTTGATHDGLMVYLEGNLGAGKSFFARSVIQAFLPGQKVKSPTYALVESYEIERGHIHHFDLYRLCDPEELEFLGIRDLLRTHFLSLVEWPSKGQGVLQQADILIQLSYAAESLNTTDMMVEDLTEEHTFGREFSIKPLSNRGAAVVKKMSENLGIKLDR